jgi:hypothetical protein
MGKLLALIIIGCSSLLTGCSYLGYYKHKKAERALPHESERVIFPDSYEEGIHLDGPAMAALEVARNEFMPPGVKASSSDERLAHCLARRDVYDVAIVKANEDLYFVSFLPNLARCGIESDGVLMDAGTVYAIDGRGRVLSEL